MHVYTLMLVYCVNKKPGREKNGQPSFLSYPKQELLIFSSRPLFHKVIEWPSLVTWQFQYIFYILGFYTSKCWLFTAQSWHCPDYLCVLNRFIVVVYSYLLKGFMSFLLNVFFTFCMSSYRQFVYIIIYVIFISSNNEEHK